MPSSSLPPAPASAPRPGRRKPPPISISTRRGDVDPLELRDLLLSSGHSCLRFPPAAPAHPVDLRKLRLALSHSSVLVSAFCSSAHLPGGEDSGVLSGLAGLFGLPFLAPERRLVGFGRAVSDGALTASIHDVVVMPSLRRLGIGRKIVQRLIRLLTSKEVYDISALCSETERLFFQACGFGDDFLGSTTMIYTRSPSNPEESLTVQHVGCKLLLIPPLLTPGTYPSKGISTRTADLHDAHSAT